MLVFMLITTLKWFVYIPLDAFWAQFRSCRSFQGEERKDRQTGKQQIRRETEIDRWDGQKEGRRERRVLPVLRREGKEEK